MPWVKFGLRTSGIVGFAHKHVETGPNCLHEITNPLRSRPFLLEQPATRGDFSDTMWISN